MPSATLPRWQRPARLLLAACLVTCLAAFAVLSRRWQWMSDEQVFRYIGFLMGRGLAPYREITDINLPGSYAAEWLATTLFGHSDFGFRLYDFSLLALLTVAAVSIAKRYDWFAGLFAGALFALIHGAEGPFEAGERDEVMTVLLVAAWAFGIAAVRRRRPVLFLCSALLFGLAANLKPTALAFALLLAVAGGWQLWRERVPLAPYLWQVPVAVILIALPLAVFFIHYHAFGAFLHALALAGAYSGADRIPLGFMLRHSIPFALVPLLPVAAILFVINRSWRNWELASVAGAAVLGFLSYLIQDKGFIYHRYPFVAFALLWCGLECAVALKRSGFARSLAAATLAAGSLLLAPWSVVRIHRAGNPNLLTHALMRDLRQFPPGSLDGRVQCLDGLHGCYAALARLGIPSSTALMGDHLLFTAHPNPTLAGFREQTLAGWEAQPPRVIVLTNFWYGESSSFRKLGNFPELAAWLTAHYHVVAQYPDTPLNPDGPQPDAYRIYELNP